MIGSIKKSHVLCFKIFDLFFSSENNIMVNLWLVGVTSLCPNSFLINTSLENYSVITSKKYYYSFLKDFLNMIVFL